MGLVLNRRVGESILIDQNTKITVSRIGGSTVTVNIDAPRSVRIRRAEVLRDEPSIEPLSAVAESILCSIAPAHVAQRIQAGGEACVEVEIKGGPIPLLVDLPRHLAVAKLTAVRDVVDGESAVAVYVVRGVVA